MRNGLKRATALAMTILMLLALLPAALAEGTELHSDGVVPGLSDGGDLAALLDEVNAADGVASANALLAAYGGISALAEGVEIDEAHYSIKVDNMPAGEDYTIDGSFFSGEVGEGTVPTVTPTAGGEALEFVGAYINNAAVTYVGTLEHEGTTYVFYTTAENESSMAATVLGGNDKIELRYTAASEVPISYEVSGDWDSAWGSQDEALDAIFGSDRPTAVLAGGSYNVEAQIPRGYTATVTVSNGNDQVSEHQLGVEPTYSRDGNQIDKSGELELETLISNDGTFVSAEQTVRIELTHRERYTFNRALWVQTEYAAGRLTDGGVANNFNGGAGQQLLWRFTTTNDTQWEMDGLQINGTQLNIPYVANRTSIWGEYSDSAVTVLPSGTTVTLTVERNSKAGGGHYTRTYTLYVSNCYENITVSGGNLNNSGSWHEIIPEKLVGVDLEVFSYQEKSPGRAWKNVSQSEPFSAHNDNNAPSRNNYILGTDGIRFTLQGGYVNPKVRYYDKSGNSQMDDNVYVSGPDRDDYYTITIDEHRCGSDTFTFLEIVADVGNYSVSYDAGVPQEGTSWQTTPDVPAEQTGYNIVDSKQIGISNEIPIDSTNQYVFHYWKLEGYEGEIEPGQTIDLEDVVDLAVDQELKLVAVWQPAATADYITYQVQFRMDGEDVEGELYTFQTARLATGGTTVVILEHAEEIRNFLNSHPDYKLDSENVYLHNDVENGDILHINFVKADTKVTITKRITGSMGDRQREFAFTVTSDQPFGEPEEENAYMLSDDKLTASFELGHEGSVTLSVPIGAQLTITETDAKGYDVSAVVGATKLEGQNASFTLTVEGEEQVTVTNNKEARPDTGIVTDSLPYVLILACVIAVVVVVVIRGRNRHDD